MNVIAKGEREREGEVEEKAKAVGNPWHRHSISKA